jgi:electron transport complex protein RnfB
MTDNALIDRLDALLPQTQCRQCGFAACRPYAAAMAAGEAATDRCPPGSEDTARALASALGTAYAAPDPQYGVCQPPVLAVIVEAQCIGCTLCIQACPVDAIIGAPKLMHGVINDACTGCGLCLPPCPVDCIELVPVAPRTTEKKQAAAAGARKRYEARERRLAAGRAAAEAALALKTETAKKKRAVEAAIKRARERIALKR